MFVLVCYFILCILFLYFFTLHYSTLPSTFFFYFIMYMAPLACSALGTSWGACGHAYSQMYRRSIRVSDGCRRELRYKSL